MEEIKHGMVGVNGIRMHIAEKGEGPVVLFLHGFPELWYTWRRQIFFPNFFKSAMEPGKIEAQIAQVGTAKVLKNILANRKPGPSCFPEENAFGIDPENRVTLPSWCSEQDLSFYATKFNQRGFTGALNYYRAMNLTRIILFIEFLSVYTTPGIKEYVHNGGFKKDVPLLEEIVVIEDAGQFINQERAKEINAHIYDFIKKDPNLKPVETSRAMYGDNFYICKFQEPGVLEAGIAHIGSKLMIASSLTTRRPGPPTISEDAIAHLARETINLPSWLSEEEFNYYVTKFDQSGFTGGLNYYRAIDF
ncbi:hypothetical protein CUMW_156730 [Citrus unshiu]|uniref:Uncharacterized protein n=3 Tax=Citrus TaxID=2706 RepID=A0A2H5PQ09_CITUN|nr:hypothetical protein CUMW_156730 [Citrus unshiu]